jgi:exodeoxyribonuclease III
MRLVTWNVNSVRQRLPRLLAMLQRHDPDVACLQETKVPDEDFPHEELASIGYHAAAFGQRGYNGVAIVSRDEPAEVVCGFPNDPSPEACRVISARVDELRAVSVYGINGKQVGDPAHELKLAWYDALGAWVADAFDPSEPLVLAGDYNIAPDDRDVHDPELWRGKNHATEPERDRIRRLLSWGLVDLGRQAAGDVAGPFTWWDYRMGAFHRGWGLRIDLALATYPIADRLVSVEVDRDERKPTFGEGKPSDHAPVVATWS